MRASRRMGMKTRVKTMAGIGRWSDVLIIFCLAFLMQVEWSLGQSRNSTSPPPPSTASAPPPSDRSPPSPPPSGTAPPPASNNSPPPASSTSPPPPTSRAPPPASSTAPPPASSASPPPPSRTSPPPSGSSPPPSSNSSPPPPSGSSPPPSSDSSPPPSSDSSPPPPSSDSSPPPPSSDSSPPSPASGSSPPPPSRGASPPPPSSQSYNPPSSNGSPPPPANSTADGSAPNSNKSSSSPNIGVYVGIGAAIVFVAFALCALVCIRKKKKTKQDRPASHPPLMYSEYDEEKASTGTSSSFYDTKEFKRSFGTRYPYSELYAATNGFTEVLGRGAFGVVYKGRLADGTEVAVKKLLDRDRGLQDFSAEVRTLGRINHANLVALRGFCFEQNQPFVLYEYVANGSLDKWIFEKNKAVAGYVMPWKTRVSALKGTAKGLAYLHEDLQIGQAIIHLDVKPENILLDDQFVPKVADFGLAKLLGSKMSQTLAAGGTMGYMAPEVVYGAATPKMDVYSFGVVLLEVLSGRRVLTPSLPQDSMFLPAWAVRKVLDGKPLDVIDPLLKNGEFDEKEAIRLVMTALLCLPRDPDERPGMSEVLRMIEGSIVPLAVPPSLQSFLEMAERMIMRSLQQSSGSVGGSASTSSMSNLISFSSFSNEP